MTKVEIQQQKSDEQREALNLIDELAQNPSELTNITANFLLSKLKEETSAGKLSVKPNSTLGKLAKFLTKATGEPVPNKAQEIKPSLPPHKLCDLKVVNTKLGRRITFTIPAGMSGREVLKQIETNNPRNGDAKNTEDGVVWKKSFLLKDSGLKTVHKEATPYTFTVLEKAVEKTRSQQEEYATENGMKLTERWIITVGAALFRDKQGFPNKRDDIGTSKDKGDAFKGLYVRALSDDLKSYERGLDEREWYDDNAHSDVAAVTSPELKNLDIDIWT